MVGGSGEFFFTSTQKENGTLIMKGKGWKGEAQKNEEKETIITLNHKFVHIAIILIGSDIYNNDVCIYIYKIEERWNG